MDILIMLIPLGLGVIAAGLGALVWALQSGQYDDLDEIARRVPD